MIDIDNIQNYTTAPPAHGSLFGIAQEFDNLPETHRAQILFLDEAASNYIHRFSGEAHIVTDGPWSPFSKGNFKETAEFSDFYHSDESRQQLKKWLYNRGIAFGTWLFIIENGNPQVILTTWKMVVKYSPDLFIHQDMMLFDRTLNRCLVFYHEDKLSFGRGNIYNAEEDHKNIQELNERKKQHPQFKHPYL